uniref:Salivary secreted peptide n=1 Tax=Bracon brevicornis TaxID=1563983 RepID=A0A6V7ISX9_9HYME
MFFKKTIVVVIVASLCLATHGSPFDEIDSDHSIETEKEPSHNLVAGNRDPDDSLSYLGLVTRVGTPNVIVSVEKTFYAKDNGKITQVIARNQVPLGKGGYAKVIKGGPGHSNVTINFESQVNQGIIYLVQIFSKP